MKLIFKFSLLLIVFKMSAQNDSLLIQFDNAKNHKTQQSMIVLASWAGANIIGGITGYALTNSYEEKQFYLMNSAWGAINMGLALPSLLSKTKPYNTWFELQKKQNNLEKIFLVNTALDLAYMMGGTFYLQKAKNEIDPLLQKRNRGFGNAIIIQGAGLFIFDLAMTLIHIKHRKNNLDPILKNTTLTFTGNSIGLNYHIN